MDELARQPDEPDAIDRDPAGMPDPDDPQPDRGPGQDEAMMRFPGEEAPDIVASGTDRLDAGEEPEAPDATGTTDEPW